MSRQHLGILVMALLTLTSCKKRDRHGNTGVTASPISRAALVFLEDDYDGALARARSESKVLFVDAWATWCHTCLSMKHYVLSEPALAPLAERAIFLSLDTEKPGA